jgi:RNA polymerase sigma factor (sigma-70 family)
MARLSVPVGERTDEELMIAYISGKENKAFDALYKRYILRITRFIEHRLPNEHRSLAEDLSNEVFMIVLKRAHTFNPEIGDFRPWLYTIAKRHRDGVFRRPDIYLRSLRESISELMPAPLIQTMTDFDKLLSQLPKKQAAVIQLGLEGFSAVEMAGILALPDASDVYRLRYQAHQRLKKIAAYGCSRAQSQIS